MNRIHKKDKNAKIGSEEKLFIVVHVNIYLCALTSKKLLVPRLHDRFHALIVRIRIQNSQSIFSKR